MSKRFFGKSKKARSPLTKTIAGPSLKCSSRWGGSGKTKMVLDRLGERMKPLLKAKDYEPHESDSKQIRWRNTAQWARKKMVNEDGRMKKNSPRAEYGRSPRAVESG